MSSALWKTRSSRGDVTVEVNPVQKPVPSIALDFVAGTFSKPLKIYLPEDLNTDFTQLAKFAGHGGYAVVQVCTTRGGGDTVAVKHSREQIQDRFRGRTAMANDSLLQMTRELRILSHDGLYQHPNIVDVLGCCVAPDLSNTTNTISSFSLVLEYSILGNMASFLSTNDRSITLSERLNLACQAGRGLCALHQANICHGDVKLQNVLIFEKENGRFIAKVSDFGSSVFASNNDPDTTVQCSYGTPLTNAPELRNSRTTLLELSIGDALRTDVFSYGVLIWEAVKNGQSFFERGWLGDDMADASTDDMEDFLKLLPHNKLLDYGQNFLINTTLEPTFRQMLSQAFALSLQDDPLRRDEMSAIVKTIQGEDLAKPTGSEDENLIFPRIDETLMTWTTHHSIYEARRGNLKFIQPVQKLVLEELKQSATSELSSTDTRAHAAMTVSECYSIGFGTPPNNAEALRWLQLSASEGYAKAVWWYDRVYEALSVTKTPSSRSSIETSSDEEWVLLSGQPTIAIEQYLTYRIRRWKVDMVKEIRDALDEEDIRLRDCPGLGLRLDILVPDELKPLHIAALFGDDVTVAELLRDHDITDVSTVGLNAAHYACVSGSLATLELVLRHGADASGSSVDGITPLHLAIFFAEDKLQTAVDLLLSFGSSTSTVSKEIEWPRHDILIEGTPLEWAVTTRNRLLTRILAPHSELYHGFMAALMHYHYEIASDLLEDERLRVVLQNSRIHTRWNIRRPFLHCITHGRDSASAIEQTVRLCAHHNLMDYYQTIRRTMLTSIGHSVDDLEVLAALIRVSPTSAIIQENAQGRRRSRTLLVYAMFISGNNEDWAPIFELILEHYSIEELGEYKFENGTMNHLHLALIFGSIPALRMLLEKGLDANALTRPIDGVTPIHSIYSHNRSLFTPELWSVLAKYGTRLEAPLLASCLDLEEGFQRLTINSKSAETHGKPTNEFENIVIFRLFQLALSPALPQALDSFRAALSMGNVSQIVDHVDRHGLTMLQRACIWLRPNVVRLLLDAGANASISFSSNDEGSEEGSSILPLQAACYAGMRMNAGIKLHPSSVFPENQSRGIEVRVPETVRRDAMETASELVQWHQARNDGLFEGITKLHLAYHMLFEEEVLKLIADGSDKTAKGAWLGVQEKLTPWEILSIDDKKVTEAARRCAGAVIETSMKDISDMF